MVGMEEKIGKIPSLSKLKIPGIAPKLLQVHSRYRVMSERAHTECFLQNEKWKIKEGVIGSGLYNLLTPQVKDTIIIIVAGISSMTPV